LGTNHPKKGEGGHVLGKEAETRGIHSCRCRKPRKKRGPETINKEDFWGRISDGSSTAKREKDGRGQEDLTSKNRSQAHIARSL